MTSYLIPLFYLPGRPIGCDTAGAVPVSWVSASQFTVTQLTVTSPPHWYYTRLYACTTAAPYRRMWSGPSQKELCPLARGSKVESIPVETAGTGVKVYTFLAPGPDAFVGESPGLQHTHRSALDSFHMHFTAH